MLKQRPLVYDLAVRRLLVIFLIINSVAWVLSYRWGVSVRAPWNSGTLIGVNNGEIVYWSSSGGEAPAFEVYDSHAEPMTHSWIREEMSAGDQMLWLPLYVPTALLFALLFKFRRSNSRRGFEVTSSPSISKF
jgi:hypothetical protein